MPLLVETVFNIFGHRMERIRTKTRVTFTGVGSIMNLRITLPKVGVVETVLTNLPVAPLDQQVAFHWFADRSVPRLLVWYAVGGWISQWRHPCAYLGRQGLRGATHAFAETTGP